MNYRTNWMLGAAVAFLGLTATVTPAAAVLLAQSPIDIVTANAVYDAALPALQFNYGSSVSITEKNINSPDVEGTARGIMNDLVQVGSIKQGANTLTIGSTVYYLQQFHFHIPSEHEFNGKLSAMEVHFVHQAADGTLAVVGETINVGAYNATLAGFFDNLTSIPNPNDTVQIANFDLSALLPSSLESYRYDGSLTTAPYTEGVKWNVMAWSQITMSLAQINQFAAMFPNDNSREVQNLNGRTVLTDVPEPSSLLVVLGGGLALFGVRRRKAVAIAA